MAVGDFVFNVKGLTAEDREQWEKDNIDKLNKLGYYKGTEEQKSRFFKNASFKNKFKNREDYDSLTTLSPEKRDSLFNDSLNDSIETMGTYQYDRQEAENKYNSDIDNTGDLIGRSADLWNTFDKKLSEVSPYYKRYKGSEYLPLDGSAKSTLMAEYKADANIFGEDAALQKMAGKIKDIVSKNQPFYEKMWNGLAGMGANIAGGIIGFAGNINFGLQALTGIDRLFGENQKDNYWQNLWEQFIDNPWTRYGDQVNQQGTFFTEDDPEKAYNVNEIIRTTAEDENLWDNVFSINTIPELMQQSGFTIASMLEGYGLVAAGNRIFNTIKYASMGEKLAHTVQTASNINSTVQKINTVQRYYNAFGVPILTGQAEAALNALETKKNVLEEAQRMIDETYGQEVEKEVDRRFQEYLQNNPLTINKEGNGSRDVQGAYNKIKEEVLAEYQEMYNDAVKRAELDSDYASLNRYVFDSVINGTANTLFKAPMFGGKVTEALNRTKVGKLFSDKKFTIDAAGNVTAKEISKKRMAWHMTKEFFAEGAEEYEQDLSGAFSEGAAENDLANYLEQRFSGVSDDAISSCLTDNLGAAFAAAGKSAISKEAIQSGIYGALGQALGTPNINAWASKDDRHKAEGKGFWGKLGAGVMNVWRQPILESYLSDKEENNNRKESAKALNDWLNTDNNREKLMSLKGSLGWAKSMQDAADAGDEFSYRNSRLGKQVQDYFMLEQLKGTPLYDAYIERYMNIINAKEGDEMAQQIAKYDDRPLADIQKDAQNALDVMQKVKEANADLEKTLGNSIPKEVKESLIFGKLSIQDWDERASKLEEELAGISEGITPSSLSNEVKQYIARHGKLKAPSYQGKIDEISAKIQNYKKNEKLLTDKQREEVEFLKKRLNYLKKLNKKATKSFEKLTKKVEEDSPILNEADILSLNPVDRMFMLNPANLKHYSEEQQEVIKKVIERGTLATSDFMNKIEDSARIDAARVNFSNQYNAAISNPNILSAVENNLRQEKRAENLRKSYQKLNEIEDYESFVTAVDNAFFDADNFESAILSKTLQDNPYFQDYMAADELAAGIYTQLIKSESFKGMSEKDKDLVATITKFLIRQGADINNPDSAIATLLSTDKNGKSKLTSFIDSMNEKLPSEYKISLDNISTVIEAYKKALAQYKKNDATKKQIEKQPSTDVKVETADPLAGTIFESGAKTLEEANQDIANQLQSEGNLPIPSVDSNSNQQGNTNEPSESNGALSLLSNDFIENNDSDVISAAEKVVDKVINEKGFAYNEEAKQKAIDAINELAKHYNSVEDFRKAVLDKIKEVKSKVASSGDINEMVGSLLDRAVTVLEDNNADLENNDPKSDANNDNQEGSKIPSQQPRITLPEIPVGKDSFLSKLFERWKIWDYIRSGKLSRKSSNRTKVYYVALDEVTEGVKEDMKKSRRFNYVESEHFPVLAVVEDPDGAITIKGKHYQAIGVLPRSEKDTRAAEIRRLAKEQPGQLVVKGNRVLISDILVASPPINRSNNPEDDKDFQTLINEALTPGQEEVMNSEDTVITRDAKLKILNDWIEEIARHLTIGEFEGSKVLFYNQSTMKGDQSSNATIVMTKGLNEVTSRGGSDTKKGVPLADVLNSGNNNAIIKFNSRTYQFIQELNHLLKRYDLSSITINKTGSQEALDALNKVAKYLTQSIYSSVKNFHIEPVQTSKGVGLDLYLGDERLGNIAESVNDKEVSDINAATILKNLFMPNGQFRQNTQFQVDKKPENFDYNSKNGKEYINNLIYDNILRMGLQSLNREISGVSVSVPEALKDPQPSNPTPVVVNTDNASASDPNLGLVPTQSGQAVDPDTGLTPKGESPKNKVTPPMEDAEKKVAQMQEDSRKIELSPDESHYVNTDTYVTYARTTSIISADENAGNRFVSEVETAEGKSLRERWEDYKKIYKESGGAYEELANKVFDLCAKIGIDIKTVDNEELAKYTDEGYTVLGAFLKKESVIKINRDAFGTGNLAQTLLHEAIHAITTYAIYNKEMLNKEAQDAVNTIEAAYQQLVDIYGSEAANNNDDLYGLSRPTDLVAELANPKFREELRKHSLLDSVIDAVKRIINSLFNKHYITKGNIEENLLKSLDSLIRNFDMDVYIKAGQIAYGDDFIKPIQTRVKTQYTTVSTNIGTGIDNFVRDFFDGLIELDAKTGRYYSKFSRGKKGNFDLHEVYPNCSGNQLNTLAKQLQELKNDLEVNRGLTIIPRDITVTGSLRITTSNGEVKEIPVAGTLDLLAYDRDGNFHIFDMKTHHSTTISQETKDKYSRQLTLYKKFLEEKYGVKVKSLNVIPIKVEYPIPTNRNVYSESANNQVMLNGQKYMDASPKLEPTMENIPEAKLDIKYDKLTDAEKDMINSNAGITEAPKSIEVVSDAKTNQTGELSLDVLDIQSERDPSITNKIADNGNTQQNNISLFDDFDDLSLLVKKNLSIKYKNEEEARRIFNSMSEREREHELGCL